MENLRFDVGTGIQTDLELQLIYNSHLAPFGHPDNIRTVVKSPGGGLRILKWWGCPSEILN